MPGFPAGGTELAISLGIYAGFPILTLPEQDRYQTAISHRKHRCADRLQGDPAALDRAQFAALREADETLYLRSAPMNLMNGVVGLTFFCDRSHYMPVAEFLERELGFWFRRASVPE